MAAAPTEILMIQRHVPLVGMLTAMGLFWVATIYYPGGTPEDANSVGYDWQRHFISTLFASTAINGEANTARFIAIPAMLVLCGSLAILFRSLSKTVAASPIHKNSIEIGGIGTAVYAFLAVVTPLHDLLVNFATLFFMVAMFAVLHLQFIQNRLAAFALGILSLVVFLITAIMYYGNVYIEFLPAAQKLTFAVSSVWILACDYIELHSKKMQDSNERSSPA